MISDRGRGRGVVILAEAEVDDFPEIFEDISSTFSG